MMAILIRIIIIAQIKFYSTDFINIKLAPKKYTKHNTHKRYYNVHTYSREQRHIARTKFTMRILTSVRDSKLYFEKTHTHTKKDQQTKNKFADKNASKN